MINSIKKGIKMIKNIAALVIIGVLIGQFYEPLPFEWVQDGRAPFIAMADEFGYTDDQITAMDEFIDLYSK